MPHISPGWGWGGGVEWLGLRGWGEGFQWHIRAHTAGLQKMHKISLSSSMFPRPVECTRKYHTTYICCCILPRSECFISFIDGFVSIASSHIRHPANFFSRGRIVNGKFCDAVFPFATDKTTTLKKRHPSNKLHCYTRNCCLSLGPKNRWKVYFL